MNDLIQLPRSALTDDLWRIPYIGQFYFYMLGHADENGVSPVSFKKIQRDLGLTRRQYRTALGKLTEAALLTASTTACATAISLNVSAVKRKSATASTATPTTALPTATDAHPQDGFARFMEYFNQGFAGTAIPKITKLTAGRKTALKNIFKEYGKETVEIALRKVLASDFLCGRETKWRATFDWIFNKTNFQKILEDTYDNRQQLPATSSDRYSSRRGTDVGDFTESDYGGPF